MLVCLLIVAGGSLPAQDFIIKSGVNLSNLAGFRGDEYTTLIKTDPHIHFHIETTLVFPITERYSMQGGLKYSGRGHSFEYFRSGEFFGEDHSVNTQMHYLDIPLSLKASFQKGNCELYVFAGGYLGAGLHGTDYRAIETPNGTVEKSESKVFGDDAYFNRWDYGAVGGAGANFGPLILEFSYSLGLADIANDDNDDLSTKNRLLSLSLGYRFME